MNLPDHLALDTNCFIYLFEQSDQPRGRYVLEHVLRPAARGQHRPITLALVLAELLVQPYRLGLPDRAEALTRAVTALPGLTIQPVDVGIASAAARLSGRLGIPLSDAIVLATAADAGAVLITNDQRLVCAAEPGAVLLLDELVAAG